MALSPRQPISIENSYAQTIRELALFDEVMHGPYPNYLTPAQLGALFPNGYIDKPQFSFEGITYRLARAKDLTTDRVLFLALEVDDENPPQNRGLYSSPSFPGGKQDRRRSSLHAHNPWGNGNCNSIEELDTIPPMHREPTPPYPNGNHAPLQLQDPYPPRPHSSNGYHTHPPHPLHAAPPQIYTPYSNGRETPTPFSAQTPYHSLIPHSHKFAQDMIVATSSQVPLERYKALVALMSILKREMRGGGLDDATAVHPEAWDAAGRLSLLKSIVLVGECLAKFGSADFNEGSNSVRAITTKDYATLLRQYLQAYGFIYAPDFIAAVSDVALQDDMMTVCNLLQTRCEANDLLFGQLIKHVGLEGNSKGGATVYNSTVVTSNPTNTVTCNPTTTTTSTSSAQARLKSIASGNWVPIAIAAAGGLAAMLLKRRLGGGRGGGADGGSGSGGRRRGRRPGPGSALEGERLMVSTLAACHRELERSRHNSELLENDWRLGKLRLASPHSSMPPGYKEVDANRCDLQQFYKQLRHEALLQEVNEVRVDA